MSVVLDLYFNPIGTYSRALKCKVWFRCDCRTILIFFQAYCKETELLIQVKELIVWFCYTLSVSTTHILSRPGLRVDTVPRSLFYFNIRYFVCVFHSPPLPFHPFWYLCPSLSKFLALLLQLGCYFYWENESRICCLFIYLSIY